MLVTAIDAVYSGVVVPSLRLAARCAALLGGKAAQRHEGLVLQGAAGASGAGKGNQPTVLFHAASMGELEQLLPIMSALRTLLPGVHIVSTSFSPSGHHHAQRMQPPVDQALYLPYDGRTTMRRFLQNVGPQLIVVDRYDVWRNMVRAAEESGIPIVLANATVPGMARNAIFRSWVADTYRRLSAVTAVTAVDATGIGQLTGRDVSWRDDSRVDRIIERLEHPSPDILAYRNSKVLTVVCGSTWPPDLELLASVRNRPHTRLILVPHEPTPAAVQEACALFDATPWSASMPSTDGHLVVDAMGMLLQLYAIADVAYVGGGFGAGVHSVTEPATYGLPIACGPAIERSRDANRLLSSGLLTVLQTPQDMASWIVQMSDVSFRGAATARTRNLMQSGAGSSMAYATEILRYLTVPPVAS